LTHTVYDFYLPQYQVPFGCKSTTLFSGHGETKIKHSRNTL